MVKLSSVFKLRADVRFRIVDDEAVVVQQQDARVMSLNETGTHILKELDGTRTVADILARLPDVYDVALEAAQADALRYLEELLGAHVIERVTSES